jgi:F0F1-type ATP synthase membrane subunit b/b'
VRPTRFPLLLTCIALLLAHAVGGAAAADAGSRTRDRVPSELWKAYPLNPGAGRVGVGEREPDKSVPSTRTSPANRGETADADEQGPAGDKTPWAIGLLAVLGLVGLLALRHFTATAVVVGAQRPRFAGTPLGRRRLDRGLRERPGRRNPRLQMRVPRIEKGSTMDKWRRKAKAHNSKRAPRPRAEPRQAHEETPLAVERISKYPIKEEAVTENQADASEDQLEETPRRVPPDAAAEVAGAEVASSLTAVGEEVQAVLSSAHDAAASIRRKAEEEAKRVRDDAWANAQAEITEAHRIGATYREDAERIRAEAEAFAADARAAAETFTEELRTSAEREAARIEDEARERLSAADADAIRKVERAEDEARERIGSLRDEIDRDEERLQSMLVILRGMSSQIEDVLAARSSSGETADESLEDVLRLDRSADAFEATARDERATSVAAGGNDSDPAHENA